MVYGNFAQYMEDACFGLFSFENLLLLLAYLFLLLQVLSA